MRIGFVTPEYVTEKNFDGGLANYLGRLCPLLVEFGHDVTVIVASERDELFVERGVKIRRVKSDHFLLPWIDRLTLLRLGNTTKWLYQSWALNRVCANLNKEYAFDILQYSSYAATGFFD